jgi:hypothetical protein
MIKLNNLFYKRLNLTKQFCTKANTMKMNYIYKENNSLSTIVLYSFIHAPFYLLSIPLGLNFGNINTLVDCARLGLKSSFLTQMLISGISVTGLFDELEKNVKANIVNKSDMNDDLLHNMEGSVNMKISYYIAPPVINFGIIQFLINSAALSSQIILISFSGLIFSHFLQLFFIYKFLTKSKINTFFKLNLLFVILNIMFYFIYINFTLKNKNLSRVNDENRLEILLTLNQIKDSDLKDLEKESESLFENFTIEQLEEIYKDK